MVRIKLFSFSLAFAAMWVAILVDAPWWGVLTAASVALNALLTLDN